jgi:hypothetical protein
MQWRVDAVIIVSHLELSASLSEEAVTPQQRANCFHCVYCIRRLAQYQALDVSNVTMVGFQVSDIVEGEVLLWPKVASRHAK